MITTPSPDTATSTSQPLAGVRVGLIDGQYIINPSHEERKQSLLDLVVAGSNDGIVMVEAGAREVTEPQVVGALEAAHAAIKQIVAAIDDLKKAAGKPKLAVDAKHIDADFHTDAEAKMFGPLAEAMRIKDKLESYGTVDEVLEAFLAGLPDEVVGTVRIHPEGEGLWWGSRLAVAAAWSLVVVGADAVTQARLATHRAAIERLRKRIGSRGWTR